MSNVPRYNLTEHYPFDAREFDPRKCFRLWSNGQLGPQNTATSTGLASTRGGHNTGNFHLSNNYSDTNSPPRVVDIERSSAYSEEATPYFTLVGKSLINNTISRAWLSDRCTPVNPKLMGGMFEMDSFARVRFRGLAADHDFSARIGFSQGHFTFDANSESEDFQNSLCFTASRGETTWRTHTCANFLVSDPGPPIISTGYRERIDTGVRVDEWHTLGVWINAAGTEARYFIDGRCVHFVNDPLHIPNRITNPSFIEGNTDTAQNGPNIAGGVALRGTGNITTNTPRLDVQWCVMRVFMERP